MNEVAEVTAAGEIFIDLIFSGLAELPELGKEIFAKEFHRELGGGAAITACALASLGTKCSVFACAGAETRDWIVSRLAEFGAGSELSVHPTEPTAITVAASMPHDRAFLSYAGANRVFNGTFINTIQSGRRLAARHVHVAFALPPDIGPALVERLHEQGCSVSLDVGWREDWLKDRRSAELLRGMDLFFPNEAEAFAMTQVHEPKAMLSWFASHNVKRVVLKLGAKGAAMLWDGDIEFVPGRAVNAVDTTGAGDCFDAGFLHAWLQGQSPLDCLRAADVCGSMSTESLGGLNALKSENWLRMRAQKGDS
ncbi:MAG TPA: carbohydrate kinase family protein [Bryobacteraceae bacterium]|jgi:sugar/nucleoside kinase (ribokinase family)|nr:carbohydrate kinase family protein [Bryobacteraceae bacterium]